MNDEFFRLERMIPHSDVPCVKEKCPYVNDSRDKSLSRYKALRKWFYFLLERPNSQFAVFYHFTSLLLILGSLVVSVLSTIKEMEAKFEKVMFYYEMFLLVWFNVEFGIRLWSCSYVGRYQGRRGRIRFLLSIYMLIDIFVILSTMTTFLLQVNKSYFAILRITRFMQVFRILRIDRQRGDFRTMGNVVKEHSKELITVYFVGFVIMFSATYIVYLCEKHTEIYDETSKKSAVNLSSEVSIDNMANGLYWAVITVTSVGYGDYSPVTWAGKVVCAIFALIGCAFFSLPAGILGSGFALQVAKQKKEKRYVKVRNPAAYLIQTMWRNYALRKDQKSSEATWYYLLPQLNDSTNSQTLETLMHNKVEKRTANVGSVFPLVFNSTGFKNSKSDSFSKNNKKKMNNNDSYQPSDLLNNNNPLEGGFKKLGKIITKRNGEGSLSNNTQILQREHLLKSKYRYIKPRSDSKSTFKTTDWSRAKQNGSMTKERIHRQLLEQYKIAIRFIMKLRYWNAIKIFKSVRHPFINMQDIMEKNAISHVEMLSQIKSMKESFNLLHQELLELRYTLAELKKSQEEPKLDKAQSQIEFYKRSEENSVSNRKRRTRSSSSDI